MKVISFLYLFSICIASLTALPVSAQQQRHKGWPSFYTIANLKKDFLNPPKGYGEVPFYWWNGDTLTKERLDYQLNLLSDAAVDGFSVSYMHTNPKVDTLENKYGYGGFGRADVGKPAIFTDNWWNLWKWFANQCAEKGLGVGLDDYVIGREGNGFYMDELLSDPKITSYQGRLQIKSFRKDDKNKALPPNIVSTYKRNDSLFVIYSEASFELYPEYGKRLVELYYDRFEKKMGNPNTQGLNYFFQDELKYDLTLQSWCEDMQQQFLKRKGYDVTKYLAALFMDIGDITTKIRLDYAQVLTELAEERYFKPIFDWHNSHGLIYGCDNYGRGLEPTQYLDYFRAISWFTAPGNDAPALGSSFRQTKVSSSITHAYNRPRTWLEAFHSMGWNSNGEWLTRQLDHHLIAGGNLLCLHGLDYTTHGGWWEWAPPCFHFRMPYWPHMKHWLRYAERMTFLLSQGHHVCDVAVLYPTEAMQAYPGFNPNNMWKVTDDLSNRGIDYDYLDYQSLQQAKVNNKELKVGKESYRTLVIVDAKAMHQETLNKIIEFANNGGVVIFSGELLTATTMSANRKQTGSLLHPVLAKGGKILDNAIDVGNYINQTINVDFHPCSNIGKVLHRHINNQDIYMVMDIEEGDTLFFRSQGICELWNADDGTTTIYPILKQNDKGTWLKYHGEKNRSSLFVFSPGKPKFEINPNHKPKLLTEKTINGYWRTTLLPTMDNHWGDYRLPATDEIIGAEAREIDCIFLENNKVQGENTTMVYGYAPYLETKNLPTNADWKTELLNDSSWIPYCYSWQFGVKDSPGSQGYHGLKGKLDDRFIILDQGGTQLFRTNIYAPQKGDYDIIVEGVHPQLLLIDGHKQDRKQLTLAKGWHKLALVYTQTRKTIYHLENMKDNFQDTRDRSAVVVYPHGSCPNNSNNPYGNTIAMKWYESNHLVYDIHGGEKGTWKYSFATAPGTLSMKMRVAGKINSLYIDGIKMPTKSFFKDNTGYINYKIVNPKKGISLISIIATPDIGYPGAAFFVEPIRLCTGEGEMEAGNWTHYGAMKYYSGGVRYNKTIHISDSLQNKLILNLGKVDATCEVKINGHSVGILVSPPYKADITKYIHKGDNEVEVLVYSTLSNHYQTIPTPYRGKPISGMLGPVDRKSVV